MCSLHWCVKGTFKIREQQLVKSKRVFYNAAIHFNDAFKIFLMLTTSIFDWRIAPLVERFLIKLAKWK
jgi:hypothetical protein